jgi:hypothetical protein
MQYAMRSPHVLYEIYLNKHMTSKLRRECGGENMGGGQEERGDMYGG